MFIIGIIILLISFVIFYIKNVYTYWKKRGVVQLSPTFPFGNMGKVLTLKKSLSETLQDLYIQTHESICGIYLMTSPVLLVRDPKLIQQILVKDFQYFHDRGMYSDVENDAFSGNLFSLAGENWKNLRTKLTPAFTSVKLKLMFQSITDCGINLENYCNNFIMKDDVIEINSIVQRFTTDIIGSIVFGINVDSINNPNTMFRQVGGRISGTGLLLGTKFNMKLLLPKLMKVFNIKSVDADIGEYLLDVINSTVNYRELNNAQHKDFLQLLIQLRNTGKVSGHSVWDITTTTENGKTLTISEIAAQVYTFFLAGLETSTAAIIFCIYELAKNEEIQNRVRKEILEVMAKHDNKLTYESLMEMIYLESCIDETLRKYPPLGFLKRICTKQIKLDDILVEKNMHILIPLLAIQRDEQYYPDPMKFDPERFYQKEYNKLSFVYIPFGDGPRNCIGTFIFCEIIIKLNNNYKGRRMGKISTKVGLCSMLAKFHYTLSDNLKKEDEIKFHATSIALSPLGGIKLKIKKV